MATRSPLRRVLWMCALLALAAFLLVLPLAVHPAQTFPGSDDKAAELIAAMQNPVQPWFHPPWQPGSEGVKSTIFALQAFVGLALLIAFLLGMALRQRRRAESAKDT